LLVNGFFNSISVLLEFLLIFVKITISSKEQYRRTGANRITLGSRQSVILHFHQIIKQTTSSPWSKTDSWHPQSKIRWRNYFKTTSTSCRFPEEQILNRKLFYLFSIIASMPISSKHFNRRQNKALRKYWQITCCLVSPWWDQT
jgi:hypothetical protein